MSDKDAVEVLREWRNGSELVGRIKYGGRILISKEAVHALESVLDELEQLQADWVRWNWDDSSTWPKAKGMYICGSADDSLPAVDEWDGENFIHYGIYDYWKPYIGPKEQTK